MRNSDGSYSQPTHTTFEAMFYRLAEFEDFMEEVGAESLDEIETLIADLNKENQTLKGNWAKLKEYVNYFKEYNIEEANMAWKITNKMQELEGGNEVVEN